MRDVAEPVSVPSTASVQRRTLGVLAFTQVVLSAVIALGAPVITLLAEDVTGSASLAGVSQACTVVGGVLTSVPLMRLSVRWGRRVGIATGYAAGALGAGLTVLGGVLESYPLLLAGPLLIGVAIAAGFQARFGAADLASPDHRARAIATVVWASSIGGVVGPLGFGPLDEAARAAGLPEFTGPYVGVGAGLVLAALAAFLLLRPDPLLLARSLLGDRGEAAQPPLRQRLASLFANRAARRSLAVLATVHAVMLAVMNMGSLHLHHGGASLRVVGLVISAHVAGMYLLSPVMGWLTDRFGAYLVAGGGLALLVLALVILQGTDGSTAAPVGAGLLLVGLGWSAGFVAGSALLTGSVPAPERPGAQGASDMLMQSAAAVAALVAGTVVNVWGYPGLTRLAAAPVLLVVLSLLWARRPALRRA